MPKRYLQWSSDMEGHARKCVERYCEFANKTTEQLLKVATPCMDDHQLKEEEHGSVGDLSAHKLFSNPCIWLVLGELTYYGL